MSAFRGAAWILSALVVAPSARAQEAKGTGIVRGKVVFKNGKPPRGVVVTDVVVYLKGEGLKPRADVSTTVLDQKDIAFVPHILVVQAGAKVEVRNSDTILHNFKTVSEKNAPLDLNQAAQKSAEVSFEHPEIVFVGCQIHAQMSAWIVVLPHSYAARLDPDGTFKIEGVPPGRYELEMWQERFGILTQAVEIGAGKATETTLEFPEKPIKRKR